MVYKTKRIFAVLLTLAMILSMLPLNAFAGDANSITIEMSLGDAANRTFLLGRQEVSVSAGYALSKGYDTAALRAHADAGEVTAFDALVKLHELALGRECPAGDGALVLSDTGILTTVMGRNTTAFSFMVNGRMPNDGVIGDYGTYTGYLIDDAVLRVDDVAEFFFIQDTSFYADSYSWFDKTELSVEPGEAFTLTLQGFMAMYYGCSPEEDVANATDVIEDAMIYTGTSAGDLTDSGEVTDENGRVTLSFDTPGTYIVTAFGEEYAEITAPWCVVTVGDENEPAPAAVTAHALFYNDRVSEGVSPIRMNRRAFTVEPGYANAEYGYVTDGLQANANKATVFDLLTKVINDQNPYMKYNRDYYLNISADGTLVNVDPYEPSPTRPFYAIVNGQKLTINKLDQTELKENDEVLFIWTKNPANVNYMIPWFEDSAGNKYPDTITVDKGENVTLTLKGTDILSDGSTVVPLGGVPIGTCGKLVTHLEGVFTQLGDTVTGLGGSATFSFDKAGTYIVTAFGTAEYDGKAYQVPAPQCTVVVRDNTDADITGLMLALDYGDGIAYTVTEKFFDTPDCSVWSGNTYQANSDNISIVGNVPAGASVKLDGVDAPVDAQGFFSASAPCDNDTNERSYYEIKKLTVTSADQSTSKTYTVLMYYGKNDETTAPQFKNIVDKNGKPFDVSHAIGPTTGGFWFTSADGTQTVISPLSGQMAMASSHHLDKLHIGGVMNETAAISAMRCRKISPDGTLGDYIDATVAQTAGSPFTTGELSLDVGFNHYLFETIPQDGGSWNSHGILTIYRDTSANASHDVSMDLASTLEFTDAGGNVLQPATLDTPVADPDGIVYWSIGLPAGAEQNKVTAKLLKLPGTGNTTVQFYYGQPMSVGDSFDTTLSTDLAKLYAPFTEKIRILVEGENKISRKVYVIRVTRAALEPTEQTATIMTKPNIMTLNSAGNNQITNILLRKPGENPLLPNGGQVGFSLASADLSTEPDPTTLFISAAVLGGEINPNWQSPIASIRLNPELMLASRGATYSVIVNETLTYADHVQTGPILVPHIGGYTYGAQDAVYENGTLVKEAVPGIQATLIQIVVHAPPSTGFGNRTYTFVVPKISSTNADFSNITVVSGSMYNFMEGEGLLTIPGKSATTFIDTEYQYEIKANYNVDKIAFYPTVNNADPASVQCTVNGVPTQVILDGMGKMRAMASLNVGENIVTLTGSDKTYTFKVIRGKSYNLKPPLYSEGVVAAGKFSPTRSLFAIANQGVTQCTATFEAEDPGRTITVTQDGQQIAEGTGTVSTVLDPSKTAAVKVSDGDGFKEYASIIRIRHELAPSRTYAFLPAPGQFTNEQAQTVTGMAGGFGWGEGWDTCMYASGRELDGSASGSPGVSLGGFGGYIIYQFDDPIENGPHHKFGTDFIVRGNPFIGNNEPAGLMVAQDKDKDGKPDQWYNLAGSEHYEDTTDWNYEVTYTNPNPQFSPNIGENVPWRDNRGGSGVVRANGFHKQIYYPNPNTIAFPGNAAMDAFDAETMTYSGVNINKLEVGFGYADTCSYDRNATVVKGNPYASDYSAFDIAWAVDENGLPVQLDEISFIKAFTCQQTDGGAVGEKSPEVLLVGRSDSGDTAVGKTNMPAGITLSNGENTIDVPLEAGKTSYDINVGEIRNVGVTVNGAVGDRIYVNNQKTSSGVPAEKTYSIFADKNRQIRVIVQNGEKEPYLCLLNLTGTARSLLTDLKLERNGTNIALTPDGNLKYKATVHHTYDSVDVIPTAADGTMVTVNGQPLDAQGKAAIALTPDTTTQIVITAENEGETETTTLSVTRSAAPNPGPGGNDTIPGFGKIIGTVSVSMKNTTFPGGAFTGIIFNEQSFQFAEKDTMMTVVLRALQTNGYGWTGQGGKVQDGVNDFTIAYISSITEGGKSLGEFSGDPGSGWMGTLNDWFVNEGFQQFNPENGDEISIEYTQNLGVDLGGTWGNSDTSLSSLTFNKGTLTPVFNAATQEYVLTLPSNTSSVSVTPRAANRNYLVKTFLNEKVTTKKEGASFYKRGKSIPVKNGDIIYIGVGEPDWPSMNNQGSEAREYTATWYQVKINIESSAPSPNTPSLPPGGGIIVPPAENENDWSNPYTDVGRSDWFYDAVKYAAQKEIMQGTGGGLFAPNAQMTRAMLVTMLYRYEGSPEISGEHPFTDVDTDQWYTKAIAWAAENGIVSGYGDGLFGTNDPVTREQIVTILYNYAIKKGLNVSQNTDLSGYADAHEISQWALSAMRWAKAEGLLNGRTPTELAPNNAATRAEVAALMMRYIEGFVKQ